MKIDIDRYNKKTVTVITDGGEHWNVSPSVLRKAAIAATSVESGNVVPFQKK